MTSIAMNIIAGCMSVVFIILAVFAIAFALRGAVLRGPRNMGRLEGLEGGS